MPVRVVATSCRRGFPGGTIMAHEIDYLAPVAFGEEVESVYERAVW
jgi:hypothetical protein